jgi:putative phosphoesterase
VSAGGKTLTVGVISDTHGLLRPEAVRELEGCDWILHAGDVGDASILDRLRRIAPLTAIRGNVDLHGPCADLPATDMVEAGGIFFYLVHSLADLDIDPEAAGVGVVISGHSHRASIRQERVLYLNPGSAGPKRFDLPVTLAKINITGTKLLPRIIAL